MPTVSLLETEARNSITQNFQLAFFISVILLFRIAISGADFRMKKKLSIHDLAAELKVSATTISFVLNGKAAEKGISHAMEERIRKYALEVGYQPNLLAKSLRTGKTNILGMLMEDISDPFFSSIARGVERRVYKLGYKIFYSSTENDTEKTRELLQLFRERQVDGYIIAPPPGLEKEIMALHDEQVPMVLYDRYYPGLPTCNVVVNNKGGAAQAVEHLSGNGYSKIGFVTLDSTQSQMQDRLDGYKTAVSNFNGEERILQVSYGLGHDASVQLIQAFLTANQELDAVIFATNYLAISGLEALRNLHWDVPGDIAVMGFDDNTHFSLFSPSVSAIGQPEEAIAETVVQRLLLQLNNKKKPGELGTVELDTEMMIRESSLSKLKIINNSA